MAKAKKKAADLVVGEKISIRGREATVTEVKVVEVPITRTTKTVVYTYSYSDEDGESVNRERHVNGSDKVEVIPPSGWTRFWRIISGQFNTDTPKNDNPKGGTVITSSTK